METLVGERGDPYSPSIKVVWKLSRQPLMRLRVYPVATWAFASISVEYATAEPAGAGD